MAAIIEVANMALGRIGEFRINSLAENSAEARHLNRFLDTTRRSLLRRHRWNFATAFLVLSEISGGASFEYEHAYNLPSDYIQAIAYNRVQGGTKQCTWKISGGRLYTNDTGNRELEYIRDVEDSEEWDPEFTEAFTWFLAAAVAPSISGTSNLVPQLINGGEAYLSRAAGGDARESGLDIIGGVAYSAYQNAREGRSSTNFLTQNWGPPN